MKKRPLYILLFTVSTLLLPFIGLGQSFVPSVHNPVVDTLQTSNPAEYWTRWKSDPCVIPWGSDSLRMYYGTNDHGKVTQIGTAVSADGNTWIEKRGEAVVKVGPAGAWDSRDVETPYAIHVPSNPDSMQYMLWYSGATADTNYLDTLCGTFFSVIYQMGMAYSPDGIRWTKYNDPTNDTSSLYAASDPVLKLPYSSGCLPDTIGMASFAIAEPSVIFDPGTSLYKMWYIGLGCSLPTCGNNDYRHRILYAESIDGINWSSSTLSLDIGSEGDFDSEQVYAPDVIRMENEYWMFYCGRSNPSSTIAQWEMQIGLARSEDGIQFSKVAGNPLIVDGSSGKWNDYGSNFPSAVLFQDTLRIYYSGIEDTQYGLLPKIGYSYMRPSVTGLKRNEENKDQLLIYPNPAREILRLQVQLQRKGTYEVFLYDSRGILVRTSGRQMKEEVQIPVKGLAKGVYYLLYRGNGQVVWRTVVIE